MKEQNKEQKKYTALSLPGTLVEELKIWRRAFSNSYNRNISYEEMIRLMLDSMEDYEPGVVAELERMVQIHPELQNQLGNYRGAKDEQ